MSGPDLSHIHEALRHLAVPVDSLTPDPKNARKHSDRNLAAIEASLVRFKFVQPLVVQRQGMIVRVGNGRYTIAQRKGWSHVPALIVDEDDVEATALAIADNRTAELAEWDWEPLSELLKKLQPEIPLSELGWDEQETVPLLSAAWIAPAVEDTEIEPEPKPVTKRVTISFTQEEWQRLCDALGDIDTDGAAAAILAVVGR